MNKSFFLIYFLLLFVWCGCAKDATYNPAAAMLSKNEAVDDITTAIAIIKKAHPSLYLYITKEKFSHITDSILKSITEEIPLADLYNKLNFIADETGCSHTTVDLPGYVYDTLQNRKFFFPYSLKYIENKLLINSYGYDVQEGAQVNKINGVPAGQIIQKLMMYNPVEGNHRKTQLQLAAEDFSLFYFMRYGQQKNFEINFTDTTGVTKTIIEKPITLSEWNDRNYNYKYYFDRTGVDYDFYFNDEKGYAIMRLLTFKFTENEKQEAFENFCNNSFELLSRKKNIKTLIIDVRENTGGELYNFFLLYSYVAQKPFKEYEKVVSRIKNIPYPQLLDADFASQSKESINKRLSNDFINSASKNYYLLADSNINLWEPAYNRFRGKLFVVTNPRVASSASYFSLMVKNSGLGKIAGEETAGGAASGNGFSILEYAMPNSKIKLFLPYAHMIYTYKDTVNTGTGLLPNYTIPDTYESFKQNKDRQISFITDSLIK